MFRPVYNNPVGPGCCMRFQVDSVSCRLLAVLLLVCSLACAENPPKISKETREEIVHAFNAELVYIRTTFPMGKTGLKLKDGTTTPNGLELRRLSLIHI